MATRTKNVTEHTHDQILSSTAPPQRRDLLHRNARASITSLSLPGRETGVAAPTLNCDRMSVPRISLC